MDLATTEAYCGVARPAMNSGRHSSPYGAESSVALRTTSAGSEYCRASRASISAPVKTTMSRPFVAPSDVPPDRLAALRRAFEATAADPAFLEAAKKSGRDIIVYTGAEIDALLAEQYSLPAEVVRRATELSAP